MADAPIRRLARLCTRWGGVLRLVSDEAFEKIDRLFRLDSPSTQGYALSPFINSHALHWERKEVIAVAHRANVGAIIHEMGHVFANAVDPDHDDASPEWEWFGWEVAVARQLGVFRRWDEGNDNYQIDEDLVHAMWGQLDAAEKRRMIADRLDFAQALGLIDANLRPRAIR